MSEAAQSSDQTVAPKSYIQSEYGTSFVVLNHTTSTNRKF
jgi:hypothetical protein